MKAKDMDVLGMSKEGKFRVRVPDEIRNQPIEWLLESTGYKMQDGAAIIAKMKRHHCVTIEDYLAKKNYFTEFEKTEVVHKIFFNEK